MDLLIQTIPLEGKTIYYVQCPTCKKDRILNSISNVSNIVSEETYRHLCGCRCQTKKAQVSHRAKLTAVLDGKEMTVKEIASLYQLSPSTIRKRIHAGKTGKDLVAPTKHSAKKLN